MFSLILIETEEIEYPEIERDDDREKPRGHWKRERQKGQRRFPREEKRDLCLRKRESVHINIYIYIYNVNIEGTETNN